MRRCGVPLASASMIAEGQEAPDFELTSDTGETVKLSELRGKPVVLYFYPKDDTPGCTKQACGIRDAYDAFRDKGAVVLGVSPDRKSTRLNSSHANISYAVFCLKKKKNII